MASAGLAKKSGKNRGFCFRGESSWNIRAAESDPVRTVREKQTFKNVARMQRSGIREPIAATRKNPRIPAFSLHPGYLLAVLEMLLDDLGQRRGCGSDVFERYRRKAEVESRLGALLIGVVHAQGAADDAARQ